MGFQIEPIGASGSEGNPYKSISKLALSSWTFSVSRVPQSPRMPPITLSSGPDGF